MASSRGREDAMSTEYVFLCGIMWRQHDSEDAGRELIRALHSEDADVVFLAQAMLADRIACA
jgi:hypothetical protein